ncbi:radical SAM protein [Pleurocapsa sp. PCC 7319]|uniref:B12-binding domain-containing radical SAM protein n=1 Tax=Pleurocapsa sp. PCC 7319 TaxID=118161 RepID=UPI000347FD14|nr:radical SAM protein [Pleurocapsa sp. PCC 7319]
MNKKTDILLIFPPITEARLFPYLSLPCLTAYLRKKGFLVAQRDLNIELGYALFDAEILKGYVDSIQKDNTRKQELKWQFRMEMGAFLQARHSELVLALEEKKHPQLDMGAVVRFIRQGIDLLIEESAYMNPPSTISDLFKGALSLIKGTKLTDLVSTKTEALVEEAIKSLKPRIVSISIPFYSQLFPSIHIAGFIKKSWSDCLIVLGGPQIMLRYEELATIPGISSIVDGLAIGAGEKTLEILLNVCRGCSVPAEVPDFVWTKQPFQNKIQRVERIPLNELPVPDFSDLPLCKYLSEEVQLPLITCIGCYWGKCCFCSYGNRYYWEKSYEEISSETLANHCLELIKKYNVKRINFVDENTNLKLVLAAVKLVEKNGERIRFSTRNRLDSVLLDFNFCSELAKRGCVLMSAGYETNSQRLLNLMNKGIKASNYQKIINNLHRVGIPLRLSVMGGLFDETAEEVRASVAFLKKNSNKIGIDVMQMLVAEPKTFLEKNPEQYKLALSNHEELRGNKLLNFCLGRMGRKILYNNGDTFNERLEEFLSFYYKVDPQMNDELYPPLRNKKQGQPFSQAEKLKKNKSLLKEEHEESKNLQGLILLLKPWIRVISLEIEEITRQMLIDLLWQKYYLLPSTVGFDRRKNVLFTDSSGKGNPVLLQLESLDTGQICKGRKSDVD